MFATILTMSVVLILALVAVQEFADARIDLRRLALRPIAPTPNPGARTARVVAPESSNQDTLDSLPKAA